MRLPGHPAARTARNARHPGARAFPVWWRANVVEHGLPSGATSHAQHGGSSGPRDLTHAFN